MRRPCDRFVGAGWTCSLLPPDAAGSGRGRGSLEPGQPGTPARTQDGSDATTITRDCSASLTRGSSRRTTHPPPRRWPRGGGGEDAPRRRGDSPDGTSGWSKWGSEASCSSRALRHRFSGRAGVSGHGGGLCSRYGEAVGVDVLQVPFDPLEPPHAASIPRPPGSPAP